MILSIQLLAYKIDEKKAFPADEMELSSGKKDSNRLYRLELKKTVSASPDEIIAQFLRFDERCNNAYKDKRKLTSTEKECTFHNENVVETKIHTLMDKKYNKLLILERRIYNDDPYANVDVVTVKKEKDQFVLKQRMLTDKEAKRYIPNPIERESVFHEVDAELILKPVKDKGTQVIYSYSMVTDHWLLNKSIAASRVFESLRKNTKLFIKSLKLE